MCGRYRIELSETELSDIVAQVQKKAREREKALQREVQEELPFEGGDIYPANRAPVLTCDGQARFMKWGFPAMDVRSSQAPRRPHINARSETALSKPTFRDAFLRRRCLVPASSYYEWQKVLTGTQCYEFYPPQGGALFFAGLYTEGGEFVILTREATAKFSYIHDRMPLLIARDDRERWLREGLFDATRNPALNYRQATTARSTAESAAADSSESVATDSPPITK